MSKTASASIAQNTRAMMLSQVITWTSSFVLMSFLPRYLGAEEYGRLYFAISASALAGLLIDLGFTMLIVKEVARDPGKVSSLFINGSAMRVIAWGISFVLTIAFVMLSGYSAETVRLVIILGVANFFFCVYDLIHRLFVGMERLEYRSMGLVIEKVFLSVVAVLLLLMGRGPVAIAVVMLLSMALNLVASLYFLRRLAPLNVTDFHPQEWPHLLKAGMPFMISYIFGFIYYRVDVMMLSSMTNETIVGWYGAPYKLFDTLMFFPVILNTAVFPVLSRMSQSSQKHASDASRKVLDLTLIVAVPTAVGMSSLAKPIISMLFGLEQYSNSVVLLQILSISLLLVYVDFVLNTVLISHDKQKKLPWVALVATVINVTMNYFAINYFQEHYGNGAIGAAITTALTEVCVMVMFIGLLPKGCLGIENVILAAKTLFIGSVMWGIIFVLERHTGAWWMAVIVGSLVYISLLFPFKVISKRELNSLYGLFRMGRVGSTPAS